MDAYAGVGIDAMWHHIIFLNVPGIGRYPPWEICQHSVCLACFALEQRGLHQSASLFTVHMHTSMPAPKALDSGSQMHSKYTCVEGSNADDARLMRMPKTDSP